MHCQLSLGRLCACVIRSCRSLNLVVDTLSGSSGFQKLAFTCTKAIAAQAFSAPGQEERSVVGLAVLRKWFGPDWGLQRHADVLCVFLLLPLAFACVRSAWHWLVFSAATVRRQTRLFSDWPPPDFFRMRGRLHVGPQPILQSNGLVAARLRLCASDFRTWAPRLVQHDTSMEGDLGVSTTLQSHVQLLEDLAWSMGGSLHDAERARKRPASQLIDSMLIAALLKNRGSLRTVLSRAVAIVCPGPIAAAANARIDAGVAPVSEASTTRTRQAFDIAFALHMRSVFCPRDEAGAKLGPIPMHSWRHSSPQSGHDWLLLHAHCLSARSAAERNLVADAVDALCQLRVPSALVGDGSDESLSDPFTQRLATSVRPEKATDTFDRTRVLTASLYAGSPRRPCRQPAAQGEHGSAPDAPRDSNRRGLG